jgi:hypothetical protein
MKAAALRRLIWVALCLSVGMYVVQGFLGKQGLNERGLTAVACVFKLAFQLAATVFAWANASRFEAGNPSRPAWRLLSLGCLCVFLGQLWYAPYQLRLQRTVFPSPADAAFVLSYPLLLLALLVFLRAFRQAGLVVPAGPLGLLAAATVAVLAVLGYLLLKPLVLAPTEGMAHFLNVFYPAADLVLLVPTVVLLRLSAALRGGHVWPVYLALLAGMVCSAAGDAAFAYSSNYGLTHLDPVFNAMFLAAYALLAQSSLYQREILAE